MKKALYFLLAFAVTISCKQQKNTDKSDEIIKTPPTEKVNNIPFVWEGANIYFY